MHLCTSPMLLLLRGCAQRLAMHRCPGPPAAPLAAAPHMRARACCPPCWRADRVELALQERARLDYTREVLQSTKSAAQRLRFAVAASGLARGLLQSARFLRQEQRGGSRSEGEGGRRRRGRGSAAMPPPVGGPSGSIDDDMVGV